MTDHEALCHLQDVLNWCYDIPDDDSRVPKVSMFCAVKAMNHLTRKYDLKMVKLNPTRRRDDSQS